MARPDHLLLSLGADYEQRRGALNDLAADMQAIRPQQGAERLGAHLSAGRRLQRPAGVGRGGAGGAAPGSARPAERNAATTSSASGCGRTRSVKAAGSTATRPTTTRARWRRYGRRMAWTTMMRMKKNDRPSVRPWPRPPGEWPHQNTRAIILVNNKASWRVRQHSGTWRLVSAVTE